jgi:hypothetical protein
LVIVSTEPDALAIAALLGALTRDTVGGKHRWNFDGLLNSENIRSMAAAIADLVEHTVRKDLMDVDGETYRAWTVDIPGFHVYTKENLDWSVVELTPITTFRVPGDPSTIPLIIQANGIYAPSIYNKTQVDYIASGKQATITASTSFNALKISCVGNYRSYICQFNWHRSIAKH